MATEDANIDEYSRGKITSFIFKMIVAVVTALFVLLQAVQGGVVPAPAIVPAPARYVAAPISAPLLAASPVSLVAAAPAPLAAYTKAVPQAISPFSASLNYFGRSPLLPYTVGGPVVSPFVETFSAPLVARRFSPVAATAPLVAGPAPFVGTVV